MVDGAQNADALATIGASGHSPSRARHAPPILLRLRCRRRRDLRLWYRRGRSRRRRGHDRCDGGRRRATRCGAVPHVWGTAERSDAGREPESTAAAACGLAQEARGRQPVAPPSGRLWRPPPHEWGGAACPTSEVEQPSPTCGGQRSVATRGRSHSLPLPIVPAPDRARNRSRPTNRCLRKPWEPLRSLLVGSV